MTHIRKLFIIIFLLFFASCKAQDIKIIIRKNIDNEKKMNFFVKILKDNDTLVLIKNSNNLYSIDNPQNDILIEYDNRKYFLKNIDNDIKTIYINYEPSAEVDCYVINKVIGDVAQTYNINYNSKCSVLTNIYLYNKYISEIETNIAPAVKIRKQCSP